MGALYKYRFSATVKKPEFKQTLVESVKSLGLIPSEVNDTVTVEGEAQFETCMGYMARFLHFNEHEFYLARRE